MKDNKLEKLKKRIWVDTICSFIVAGAGLLSAYSKLSLLSTVYKYAKENIEEIAELAGGALGHILISLVFIVLGLMLVHIRKGGKPFSKSNIIKVQMIACFTIGCGMLPSVLSAVIVFISTKNFDWKYEVHEIIVMFLGAAIGIISEIFFYGNELQEDVDLIAKGV